MPTTTTKRAATATMARSKPRRSNMKDSPQERTRLADQTQRKRLERLIAAKEKDGARIRAALEKSRATTWARAKPRRSNKEEAPLKPFPVAKTNITPEERARLADPNFVTEDEADNIICDRRLREGGRLISLPQLLKRYGRKPRAPVER